MVKKAVSIAVAVLLLFSASMVCAQAADDEHQAKLKDLNEQMKEARDAYKQKMKGVDDTILQQMRQIAPDDKEARDKLLDQKRDQKKQIQLDYRKEVEGIRAQVDQLKGRK
ncbi:MAG: hypothetical protein U9R44_06695 [Candidatus Omnitrophota bacterium]|nr:hypothetical protein [Candidatus Omnitrophota bacterium]